MMVSSVAKKELTHEWENERYKDYQVLIFFFKKQIIIVHEGVNA